MYQGENQLSSLLLSGHESGVLCAQNRRKPSPLAVSDVRLPLCSCDFSLTHSPPPLCLTWLHPISVSQQEESEEMQQTSAPGAKLLCSLTANCVELIDNQL